VFSRWEAHAVRPGQEHIVMRRLLICSTLYLMLTGAAWETAALAAPLTAAQKKELNDIRTDVGKVASLVSRKKIDEAEEALKDAEGRLDKLVQEADPPETDPLLRAVKRAIETQRNILAKATGGKTGPPAVSFAEDVAPILSDKCLGCHGANNPRAGLRMDTFASMEIGGRSGRVLVPGNPRVSLLFQKITALDPQARMPQNAPPLSEKEILTIANWIAAGAQFDGTEKNVALSLLAKNPALAREKIEIVKATGNEKVSFVRDIAPTFVNTCGNCHGGNNPRGGLSLATFERVMAGGESGKVIVPGNVEGSRMFQLLSDGTMPQGNQARITRKWYADLQTWIKEGAKYDGSDPRRPLRDLIPTPEQLRAEELAKLTPEGWLEKRKKDSKDLWMQTFPQGGEPQMHATADFLVLGDVAPRRLEEVGGWAQNHAAVLRSMFNVKDEPLFKGKLAIFVFKDRFGYEEFNATIHRREVPREVVGHSDVTVAQDRAFAAVQDIGDDASPNSPGLHLSVVEHVTGAFLERSGGNIPDWLTRGTGLALAATKSASGNPYIASLRGLAGDALRRANLSDPADVFNDGQFSPADIGPIGYVLVDFLLKQGGGAGPFGQLVKRFQAGDNPAQAIQAVYRNSPRQLGASFVQSAGIATSGTKKKKAN
jgi:cytochrome c553